MTSNFMTTKLRSLDVRKVPSHVFEDYADSCAEHHAKIYNENETHIVLTIFANNRGSGDLSAEQPSQESSFGLVLVLQTAKEPMTADLTGLFAHPEGGFTGARGSVSILPNSTSSVYGWGGELHAVAPCTYHPHYV